MFLLTFALLVISMLGVYTQVYALEAARLFASQTGIGQTILNWHYAAASLAGNVVNPITTPIPAAGCRLSPVTWAGGPAICTVTVGGGVVVAPPGTLVTADAPILPAAFTVAGRGFPQRPPGYNVNAYLWNSIVFQSADCAYCVMTFVSAAPGATIATAPAPAAPPTQLNLTESDLFRQLQNLGIPGYSFGYVTNPGIGPPGTATLLAGPSATAAPTAYTVPVSIPNGALAIISSPGQCTGC